MHMKQGHVVRNEFYLILLPLNEALILKKEEEMTLKAIKVFIRSNFYKHDNYKNLKYDLALTNIWAEIFSREFK